MESVNNMINRELDSLKINLDRYFDFVDNVYVVPHQNMDFDALGAATAMCELALNQGKRCFIVVDDEEELMEYNLRKVYNTLKVRYCFITTDMLNEIRINPDRELTCIVDINKPYLTPIQDILPSLNNIVIIDHHEEDKNTIKYNYAFIRTEMSSASEIMYNLLKRYNIKPYSYLANALYAGIYLDTRGLGKFNEYIALTTAELQHYGASHEEVKKLFKKPNASAIREEERIISFLIDDALEIDNKYVVAYNRIVPDTIYSRDILGKSADRLIETYPFEISFTVGFIDNAKIGDGHSDIIQISARSSVVNMDSFMKQIGGGGRKDAAAATFITNDIGEVIKILVDALYKHIIRNSENNEDVKKLVLMPLDIKKQI